MYMGQVIKNLCWAVAESEQGFVYQFYLSSISELKYNTAKNAKEMQLQKIH